LLEASPSLRTAAEAGKIVYGINCVYTFPVSGKTKTLDFVIAEGTPDAGGELIGGVILPARSLEPAKVGNRMVKKLDLRRLIFSCESKATMTEHGKSKPRIFDELNSSHEIVHKGDSEAIAAGITVVNIATTFVSPTRQKGKKLIVTKHRQPADAQQMIEHLRGLSIRAGGIGEGFDAYATIVVDCDNQKMASLWTDPPAPQPGERDHSRTFLDRLSRACEDRLVK
jgi:hypothetical protein